MARTYFQQQEERRADGIGDEEERLAIQQLMGNTLSHVIQPHNNLPDMPIRGPDTELETEVETEVDIETKKEPLSADEAIRQRLIVTLTIFPRLTPSMLQSAVGPTCPARVWKPIMEQLISRGILCRKQEAHVTEHGRHRIVVVISLSETYICEVLKLPRAEAFYLYGLPQTATASAFEDGAEDPAY